MKPNKFKVEMKQDQAGHLRFKVTERVAINEIVADIKHCMEMYPANEVAYIIRAVNSHMELLEAATYAACPDCEDNRCEGLRRAIANVKGGL